MSRESNLLAATQRLRDRLRAAEARNDELEELLARALVVSEAMESMLGQALGGEAADA